MGMVYNKSALRYVSVYRDQDTMPPTDPVNTKGAHIYMRHQASWLHSPLLRELLQENQWRQSLKFAWTYDLKDRAMS